MYNLIALTFVLGVIKCHYTRIYYIIVFCYRSYVQKVYSIYIVLVFY